MTETQALTLAGAAAACFGTALVSAKFGLRTLDARSGAAISIPTATVLLGAVLLREEPLSLRMIAGALLVVAGVAYLVAGV